MVKSTHTLIVEKEGRRIPVTVSRKRVRNLNLRIRSDGSVTLSIPNRTSMEAAQAFLDKKADWIVRHVQQREDARRRSRMPDDFATIPLWGSLVPTELALERAGMQLKATAPIGEDGAGISPADYELLVDELYRREIAHALPEVSARGEAAMGVRASRWSLRDMKTRWGSCTPATRAIRINTKLAAYPLACLEFVVAHELTHLMEPSHNARFHLLLDIYCPNNREAAALLKRSARAVADERGASQPDRLPRALDLDSDGAQRQTDRRPGFFDAHAHAEQGVVA